VYSSASLARVPGGGVNAEQMESLIADEIPSATEAAANSEIDLRFNLVHVAPVSTYARRAFLSPLSWKCGSVLWFPLFTVVYRSAGPIFGSMRDDQGRCPIA